MNHILRTLPLLTLVLVSRAAAADPSGVWKSTALFGNQAWESTLQLRLDSEGPHLSGFCFQGASKESFPLEATQYKGGHVAFTVRCLIDGQPAALKYEGKLNGDTIQGKSQCEIHGQLLTGSWTAKRQK